METAAATFASALLDPRRSPPPGLKTWNGSNPERRFNVYRNNVVVSLIDALTTTFPVTRALVGPEFFRAMVRHYISQSPPASPLLAEYGNTLPDFIRRYAPASELPYLADVARLEHLRVVVYHAADATPLGADAFHPLLADPDGLLALRLRLHPACRWLRSAHPVVSLWAAHQGNADLSQIDLACAEDALVIRPALDVKVLALPPGGVELLEALSGGASLADAVGRAFAANQQFDLPGQLAGLIGNGAMVRLIHPNGDCA